MKPVNNLFPYYLSGNQTKETYVITDLTERTRSPLPISEKYCGWFLMKLEAARVNVPEEKPATNFTETIT